MYVLGEAIGGRLPAPQDPRVPIGLWHEAGRALMRAGWALDELGTAMIAVQGEAPAPMNIEHVPEGQLEARHGMGNEEMVPGMILR